MTEEKQLCSNCGTIGMGKYCFECGQKYNHERITISHLVHEVFHFFTHMESGFIYTLHKLVIEPGSIQQDYLEGKRGKIQRPFSMFFLCATACGLCMYWINFWVVNYEGADNVEEVFFFQHYLVIVQIFLTPVYALVSYLFFIRYKYNYAEWLIIVLYTTSFFFLIVVFVNCLKFIWPHLDTKYIELPVLIIYSLVTNNKLFHRSVRWKVIIISICSLTITYAIAEFTQEIFIKYFVSGQHLP
ncbi:MAG: DUF3667 domain-containing protein [Chitinophagales bacterium]|nr:DUF3667 domain-containing protein [Chitinophagales bacterium]